MASSCLHLHLRDEKFSSCVYSLTHIHGAFVCSINMLSTRSHEVTNAVLQVAPQLNAPGRLLELASGHLEEAQQIDARVNFTFTSVVGPPPQSHDGPVIDAIVSSMRALSLSLPVLLLPNLSHSFIRMVLSLNTNICRFLDLLHTSPFSILLIIELSSTHPSNYHLRTHSSLSGTFFMLPITSACPVDACGHMERRIGDLGDH